MSRQDLRGSCPGLPPSNAEQYANPNRRCLPLPIPNSNHKTPYQKRKSVRSLTLIQEVLVLKIHPQTKNKGTISFGYSAKWSPSEPLSRGSLWPFDMVDADSWSPSRWPPLVRFSVLHMGLGSLGRSGAEDLFQLLTSKKLIFWPRKFRKCHRLIQGPHCDHG